MHYKMKVVICHPENTAKERTYNIDCVFIYDPSTYGNGHWLGLFFDNGSEYYEDLRYFTEVPISNKIGVLAWWANAHWTGKDGAFAVKSLEISKAE